MTGGITSTRFYMAFRQVINLLIKQPKIHFINRLYKFSILIKPCKAWHAILIADNRTLRPNNVT